MNCLETERLIGYAYHLMDEAAACEVRAHLGACSRCREIVEPYGRLDAALDQWKAAEPTPGFDARVRQAVEAQQARRESWGFWGRGWTRGLALASLGVLIIAEAVWLNRSHTSNSNPSRVAVHKAHLSHGTPAPAQLVKVPGSADTANVGVRPAPAVPKLKSAGDSLYDDKDAQALEDYDLAANFDLLSELPQGGPGVAN